jgi:carbon-monoxide dehydrogenase large subunit
MGQYAIGQAVPRTEDPRLLRGDGRYFDDLTRRGQVHVAFLRSPHAHADLIAVDTETARAAPGVLAVLTGEDYQAAGLGDLPSAAPFKKRDGSGMFRPPRPALGTGRVRMVGEIIAVVVAETANLAQDAVELITVDYDPLPAVADIARAITPDAPLLWDQSPGNEAYVHYLGDREAVDAAFDKAAHIVRQNFRVTRVTANAMEPRGCIAEYDHRYERYKLWAPQQSPHQLRYAMAIGVLGIPETDLSVYAGDIGGAFGLKNGNYAEYALCLWVAKIVGKPVRWLSSRSEGLLSDEDGRDHVTDAALALDEDGRFLALKVKTLAAMGAYLAKSGVNPPVGNAGGLAGVYTTPAISVEIVGVHTNTNSTAPYRGAGRPEASYVIERLIDMAAIRTGIDPIALRRRNLIAPDAMPYKTGLTFTYDCGEFEAVMDKALAMADFDSFEERRADAANRGKLRGIGFSVTIEKSAGPGIETADIRFDPSGTITLLVGTTGQGQGHDTIYKQIVSDRLGIDSDDIRLVEGDTDKVAFGRGTFGSRSATIAGTCLLIASDKIIEKGRKLTAHAFETAIDDIEFTDGAFRVAGTDRSMSLKEIAALAHQPLKIPVDMEPGLDESAAYSPEVGNFPNGCHVCELEIDPETGVTEIIRYLVVDDVGVAINPLLVKGQIQGGIVQGLGQIFMEDKAYDDDSGQLLAGSFLDYCMPRADDLCGFEMASHPVPTATNPLGVKGVGECGTVGALPTAMNAVVDALKPLGVTHVDMPVTPPRLWKIIKDAQAGNGRDNG